MIDEAVAKGAEVTAGDGRISGPNTTIQPRVINKVNPSMSIPSRWIFRSRVMHLPSLFREGEAVKVANDT